VGADLVAPLTFSGAANHDDGDDALLGAGHGLALLCSASAPVAERGGGRDRGRARRDLWRRDLEWRRGVDRGIFSRGDGDQTTRRWAARQEGSVCVGGRRRAISGRSAAASTCRSDSGRVRWDPCRWRAGVRVRRGGRWPDGKKLLCGVAWHVRPDHELFGQGTGAGN